LIDLHDVRAQLSGGDSQIEVRLGGQDLGDHLKLALAALDQYKQSANGSSVTYVDVQGDRVVLGTSSGNKVSNVSDSSGTLTSTPVASPSAVSRVSTNNGAAAGRGATATADEARKRRGAATERTQQSRGGKDPRDRQR
jgi:hypothetical protein